MTIFKLKRKKKIEITCAGLWVECRRVLVQSSGREPAVGYRRRELIGCRLLGISLETGHGGWRDQRGVSGLRQLRSGQEGCRGRRASLSGHRVHLHVGRVCCWEKNLSFFCCCKIKMFMWIENKRRSVFLLVKKKFYIVFKAQWKVL